MVCKHEYLDQFKPGMGIYLLQHPGSWEGMVALSLRPARVIWWIQVWFRLHLLGPKQLLSCWPPLTAAHPRVILYSCVWKRSFLRSGGTALQTLSRIFPWMHTAPKCVGSYWLLACSEVGSHGIWQTSVAAQTFLLTQGGLAPYFFFCGSGFPAL